MNLNHTSFLTNAIVVWLILGAALFAMLRVSKMEDGPPPEGTHEPLWLLAIAYGLCLLLSSPVAMLYFVVGTIAGAR